jgi:hypothetical protein
MNSTCLLFGVYRSLCINATVKMSGAIPPFPIFLHGLYRNFSTLTNKGATILEQDYLFHVVFTVHLDINFQFFF